MSQNVNQEIEASLIGETRPAYELPPEEWVRKFRAWTESHADLNLPILSDDDISRESIYADRGL